ncbi:hypothetical protein BDN70DRAFT_939938 [Pholiota conissans]|uniref:Uncharacterized protein n=1 Tax=Pholiota conissans TaxID=109636 RepID=A0A9P6CRM2_9AGAR|nr:hypothetical protein BDN70DRAFT_939938 [Pholiota conissans]
MLGLLEHMKTMINLAVNSDPSEFTVTKTTGQPATYPIARVAMSVIDRRWQQFEAFFRQSVDVYSGNYTEPTILQRMQIISPEQHYPFREQLSARKRMMSMGGPFHTNNIRTLPGIFSAIIWRAITYRTEFSEAEKMLFVNIDDWNATVSKIPSAVTGYICNKAAYGSTNPGRSEKLVPVYWKQVQNLEWEAYCRREETTTFQDTMRLFSGRNDNPFPHLGLLGAFDLVVDLTYCSKAIHSLPTNMTVAECIFKINRGSMNGVMVLNGGNPSARNKRNKADVAICNATIGKAIEVMHNVIDDTKRADIIIDNILAENALLNMITPTTELVTAWTDNIFPNGGHVDNETNS